MEIYAYGYLKTDFGEPYAGGRLSTLWSCTNMPLAPYITLIPKPYAEGRLGGGNFNSDIE